MKVGLISVPKVVNYYSDMFHPSLAIAHIEGYLKDNNYDVEVVDLELALLKDKALYNHFASMNNLDMDILMQLKDRVTDTLLTNLKIGRYDVLGFSINCVEEAKFLIHIMSSIKRLFPAVKIVAGGTSPFRYQFRKYLGKVIDYIVVGRGEEAFADIIDGKKNIPGAIYHDGHIVDNSSKGAADNLYTQRLFFRKSYVDEYRLYANMISGLNNPFPAAVIPYYFSKGCIFNCAFCIESSSNCFSHKKVDDIVKDIKLLKEMTGSRYFAFMDNNLAFSKDFLDEFCSKIKEMDILWMVSIKASSWLTQETFYSMRHAGCIYLDFGLETASDRLLHKVNKGHTSNDVEDCIIASDKAGIWNCVNIIVGIPGESDEDFLSTKKFMVKNDTYVNWWKINQFYLNKSRMMDNPDIFGISFEGYADNDFDTKSKYSENGLCFEEVESIKKLRYDILVSMGQAEFYKSMCGKGVFNELLFPLYDILSDKEKVVKFLEDNFCVVTKRNMEFGMIYTGLASNQSMKGMEKSSIQLRFLKKSFILERMDMLKKEGFKKILVSGGEPLIHPNIIEILKYADDNFSEVVIFTNARMLKYADFCKKVNEYVDMVIVVWNDDNGVKGAREQMLKGVENWKELGKEIRCY